MTGTVPILSIIIMIFDMLFGILIPVFLYVYMRKKRGADRLPFLIGIAIMFLFANVLEQAAHTLILGSAAGDIIRGNVFLYGLYGGLMAGIFEESGRFIAFMLLMKKYRYNDNNALMYGAGHGGFEAFMILTLGMVNNLVCAVMLNTGNIQAITGTLSGSALQSFESSMQVLVTTSPFMFLLAAWERAAAVIMQLSFSVLVWFAAKKGRKAVWLFPLAVFLHMFIDAVSVILKNYISSTIVLEAIITLGAFLIAFIAYRVWKKNCK